MLFASKALFEIDLREPNYNEKEIALAQDGVQREILFCILLETDVL
jgi:hypothetical protein